MVLIYQYVGVLIGIIAILVTFLRFREGKMSWGMLFVWSALWITLILISIYPDSTTIFAKVTGIGRGLDLALILGLIGCYYLIFKIYNMIENIEQDISQLVRELALQRENIDLKEEKDDEKQS
jgi:hypothetical protein